MRCGITLSIHIHCSLFVIHYLFIVSYAHLYEKIHVTHIVVRGDRGVCPYHHLSVNLHQQYDVLADRKTEDMFLGRQSEPELSRIVAEELK